MRIIRPIIILSALASSALAETVFPPADYEPRPSEFSSPLATKGGRIRVNGIMPKSLNALLDSNTFSWQVFGLMYESLLGSDDSTGEHARGLAKEWRISDDGNVFTFVLDPAAKWSDGLPVSAEDVLWSFHTILNPAHMTGSIKIGLEKFNGIPPEIIAPGTIRFTASETHWRNLDVAGGFPVMPKHVFEGKDFNKINFDFPVVSGPYRLGKIKENISVEMLRRPDWWAADYPENANLYNFDVIEFVAFMEGGNAWEAFRKDMFDFMSVYSARVWERESSGRLFANNWVVKKSIRNKKAKGFQGFAMNMRRFPFDDPRVRQALAHLLDRKSMNETMMFNAYFLHRSYFEDLYDDDTPCENPFFDYNPEKARTLLDEAGWRTDPATGKLVKDGKPLVLRFLARDSGFDRFLARYKNDLARVGIGVEVERKDWAAWMRDMDSFNFDITWAGWSAGTKKDPEAMWHSDHAKLENGNNITGFSDPQVDALIERQKSVMSLAERNAICREIDGIITAQVPYVLLWNADSCRLLWWNRFGMPDSVISRLGDEYDALRYWWYDPDSAAALADAVKNNIPIPAP